VQVNPEEGGGIDWSSEMDRMLVMKMIIKMADINTPTKSLELHRKWTERITEEFYQQVREEEEEGGGVVREEGGKGMKDQGVKGMEIKG
jgi:cGMP-inhibited 3',5'-cyclic phosphodiesterase A